MQNDRDRMQHSVQSANLADVLERVLDKGVVIAGDIKIKLVDIELLSIHLRLVVASVDKAKEMGIDWWTNHPYLTNGAGEASDRDELARRVEALETATGTHREHEGDSTAPDRSDT